MSPSPRQQIEPGQLRRKRKPAVDLKSLGKRQARGEALQGAMATARAAAAAFEAQPSPATFETALDAWWLARVAAAELLAVGGTVPPFDVAKPSIGAPQALPTPPAPVVAPPPAPTPADDPTPTPAPPVPTAGERARKLVTAVWKVAQLQELAEANPGHADAIAKIDGLDSPPAVKIATAKKLVKTPAAK